MLRFLFQPGEKRCKNALCSVVFDQTTLLDLTTYDNGSIADKIVKCLHPKIADIETLDPSALSAFLDTHPQFRTLCSAKERQWLRFNKSLIPRVIGLAPDYFGGRAVEVFISNMYRRNNRISIPTDVQFRWGYYTTDGHVKTYTRADEIRIIVQMPQFGMDAVRLLTSLELVMILDVRERNMMAFIMDVNPPPTSRAKLAKTTRILADLEPDPIMYVDPQGYITREKPPPHTAAEEWEMALQESASESDSDDSDEDYAP